MPLRLRIQGTRFKDAHNREVTLHGINVAGDAKLPAHPDTPSHVKKDFFKGDDVSFVGRPFTVHDSALHFARLKRWGYNTIRYIFTWEAIEHAGPGKYDEEWIQHTIDVLHVAKDYGFYIFMDPHQDVWSRFTGGSGAPMWTLYACGLDPEKFAVTEAAVVQNTFSDPKDFPKMIWATNYTRLACQVMFTVFFAGRSFAPKAIIDGKNIQDYLQDHLFGACQHLAKRIKEAGDLDHDVIIGWESMNEPNRGMIGLPNVAAVPPEQKLQKGTSPTAFQAMLTGSGRPCEIDVWDFGGMGPYKSGSSLVDPQGQIAWLHKDYDDTKYGWKRDPGWKLGQCLWAQHGVWNPSTDTILKKEYFANDPSNGAEITYEYFTNHWFMDYYRRYKSSIREVFPDTIMFCQAPVLEIPPTIKGTSDDDPNMVFAPHFYDGLTLMTKKWNRLWNVDVFGVLRGRYRTPAFAIKVGETAIRNCFRDQLRAIMKEGTDNMGNHPCVFTEIGIPFDMDNEHAYKTGDFSSQVMATDANHFALEGNTVGFTWWVYTASNEHEWGDQWNGEDLSVYSRDDTLLPSTPFSRNGSSSSLDQSSPSYSESHASHSSSTGPSSPQRRLDPEYGSASNKKSANLRAAEAYVRATPMVTYGDISSFGFDLRNCEFKLSLHAPSATPEDACTEIFLPEYHFPENHISVEVSGGKWTVSKETVDTGTIQILKWWHAEGDQTLKVKGVTRRQGLILGTEEDEGYLEHCRQKGCTVM